MATRFSPPAMADIKWRDSPQGDCHSQAPLIPLPGPPWRSPFSEPFFYIFVQFRVGTRSLADGESGCTSRRKNAEVC